LSIDMNMIQFHLIMARVSLMTHKHNIMIR
jgi:hypothetical protein